MVYTCIQTWNNTGRLLQDRVHRALDFQKPDMIPPVGGISHIYYHYNNKRGPCSVSWYSLKKYRLSNGAGVRKV